MKDASEDEDDGVDDQLTVESKEPQRNLRAERQAKLRKMMEDDDEEDEGKTLFRLVYEQI